MAGGARGRLGRDAPPGRVRGVREEAGGAGRERADPAGDVPERTGEEPRHGAAGTCFPGYGVRLGREGARGAVQGGRLALRVAGRGELRGGPQDEERLGRGGGADGVRRFLGEGAGDLLFPGARVHQDFFAVGDPYRPHRI